MSLPDGVTTCLLTYGPITDTFGNLADSISVEVVADRTIVHAASGRTLFKNPVTVTADGGGIAQLPVPHTDQSGFRDQAQNALTGWYYTVRLTARFGSDIQTDTKVFQPVVGQSTVDLDLLPSNGMVTPGVTAPTATVTSVNGQTGVVELEISGNGLPSTILSKTATYTAAAGEFILANTSGGAFTVTLPAAPDVGALVTVKKVSTDTNTLTILPAGGGTIDGDANATTATKGGGAVFEHVGSNVWQISAVTLTTGPAGPVGPAGATGPAGPTGPTGAAGAIAQVQDEGTNVAVRGTLNFVGSGVTVSDDAANSRTTVNVSGGGGGGGSLSGLRRSGGFYPVAIPNSGGVAAVNQREYAIPVIISNSCTVDTLACEVTIVGNTGCLLRLGLRADNGSGLPGTLVLDGGTVVGDSLGIKTKTVSQALTPGLYWATITAQNAATTAPTMRMQNPTSTWLPLSWQTTITVGDQVLTSYYQNSVSGALPGSFTYAGNTGANSSPNMWMRFV